jgi:hypothetical protein
MLVVSFPLTLAPEPYMHSSSHSCYMSSPPHPHRSNYSWRKARVLKLLIVQFLQPPVTSCHLLLYSSHINSEAGLKPVGWFLLAAGNVRVCLGQPSTVLRRAVEPNGVVSYHYPNKQKPRRRAVMIHYWQDYKPQSWIVSIPAARRTAAGEFRHHRYKGATAGRFPSVLTYLHENSEGRGEKERWEMRMV